MKNPKLFIFCCLLFDFPTFFFILIFTTDITYMRFSSLLLGSSWIFQIMASILRKDFSFTKETHFRGDILEFTINSTNSIIWQWAYFNMISFASIFKVMRHTIWTQQFDEQYMVLLKGIFCLNDIWEINVQMGSNQ